MKWNLNNMIVVAEKAIYQAKRLKQSYSQSKQNFATTFNTVVCNELQ